MKRTLMAMAFAAASTLSFAQQAEGWKLTWHGFVNPQIWADTRQVIQGREDMMAFYPMAPGYDEDGIDTNAVPSLNMLSITTRLSLTIQGPEVMGAQTKGYIETDFTGSTNAAINNLRLRHAYIDMRWTHSDLLMGQYWHPMVIHEIMPGTMPLSMGAPFHPYARYNQVKYTHFLGGLELSATAAFQLDNKSNGPLGASTQYIKRSMVPEMNLQMRYSGERIMLGVAANTLTIQPRRGQNFSHTSYTVYGKADIGNWSLRAQSLLNSNLYEASSMGGYVETYNPMLDQYSYSPYTYTTAWLDFGRRTGSWRPGIFVGYASNNTKSHEGTFYGRGQDMESLYRIQPRLTYVAGHGLTFSAEWEYTSVKYMKFDNNTSNNRFVLSAVYAF